MKRVIILVLTSVLAACATSTGYETASSNGLEYGYIVQQLGGGRYEVQYRLVGQNIGKAQDYALLRAAELTLESDGDWFEVIVRGPTTHQDNSPITGSKLVKPRTVTTSCGLLGCRARYIPNYAAGTPTIGSYDGRGNTVVNIEIVMGSGAQPSSSSIYDASQIAGEIRRRLG